MSTLFASPAERYVTLVAPIALEARAVIGAGGAEIGGGAGFGTEKAGLVIAFTSGMGTGRELEPRRRGTKRNGISIRYGPVLLGGRVQPPLVVVET